MSLLRKRGGRTRAPLLAQIVPSSGNFRACLSVNIYNGVYSMSARAPISPEDVILRVLQEAQQRGSRPIYRTALVKLVYLVDYIYAQHTGRTLTGFEYVWDDYGPNAVGNKIVKGADRLHSAKGMITIDKGLTPSGNAKYQYHLAREARKSELRDELGERIIKDVIMSYGNLNWAAIVRAAKATPPVMQAKPGDRLDLAPDSDKQRRLARLQAVLAEREYETGRPSVSIRELKARYGLVN